MLPAMGQYFCIILGTGATAVQRTAAMTAIATSWGTTPSVTGNYICILIGTGPEATARADTLAALAKTWGAETCTSDAQNGCC